MTRPAPPAANDLTRPASSAASALTRPASSAASALARPAPSAASTLARPAPSAASTLARPLPLLAVALLVVNDHWAKQAYPGWLTGKLSDVAGMVFFPLLLAALAEGALGAFGVRPPPPRTLAVACAATALAFALAKTTQAGNAAYRAGLGYAQWPFYAIAAAARGRPAPPPRDVVLVRDPSDLIALPFVCLAYALAARRVRAPRPSRV